MPAGAGFSQTSSGDAPPYFNEPTWNEKFPSATGFHQAQSFVEGPEGFGEPAYNERMPSSAGFI
jgi:hypothetical protein